MTDQPATQEWTFPCQPSSVSIIRRATRATLTTWGLDALNDDAELCVSELAGNAVVHGPETSGRQMALVISVTKTRRLRVEVHDPWDGVPHIRRAYADEERGRGMFLLSALVADWGVAPRFDGRTLGKVVWFELALPDSCPQSPRVGPHVGVTQTGDAEYPYRIDFPAPVADSSNRQAARLTTAQAMTLISRLASMLGLELGPAR